jgi:hypothetical protein
MGPRIRLSQDHKRTSSIASEETGVVDSEADEVEDTEEEEEGV